MNIFSLTKGFGNRDYKQLLKRSTKNQAYKRKTCDPFNYSYSISGKFDLSKNYNLLFI